MVAVSTLSQVWLTSAMNEGHNILEHDRYLEIDYHNARSLIAHAVNLSTEQTGQHSFGALKSMSKLLSGDVWKSLKVKSFYASKMYWCYLLIS